MKRAKLAGLKRDAAVALGNVGTAEGAQVLTHALADPDLQVREHAASDLAQVGGTLGQPPAPGGGAGRYDRLAGGSVQP